MQVDDPHPVSGNAGPNRQALLRVWVLREHPVVASGPSISKTVDQLVADSSRHRLFEHAKALVDELSHLFPQRGLEASAA